jgi:curli biogenesis system outer membrane secretion channel CsgG
MSNPVIEAFFFGRAFAEVLSEKVEDAFTNALSELGKFDAEQRENLRQFTEEVKARAAREAANSQTTTAAGNYPNSGSSEDLQEMLDRLRAEIASLKAELKNYRNQ